MTYRANCSIVCLYWKFKSEKFRLWNSNIFNRDSRLKHLNCFEDIYPSTSKLVRDTIKKLFTFRQMKHFKSVKNPIKLNLIVLLIQWPSLINQIPNIKTFKIMRAWIWVQRSVLMTNSLTTFSESKRGESSRLYREPETFNLLGLSGKENFSWRSNRLRWTELSGLKCFSVLIVFLNE